MSAAWKVATDLPSVYERVVQFGPMKRHEVINRISQPNIDLEPLSPPTSPCPSVVKAFMLSPCYPLYILNLAFDT